MKKPMSEFWWETSKTPLHEKVFCTMEALSREHEPRLREYFIYMNQYASQPQRGSNHLGMTPFNYGRVSYNPTKRIRCNVIRSALDTLTALAASDRPRPMALTEDGTASRMRQAAYLNKFFLGIFNRNKVYENGPIVFRDAGLFGWGTYKASVDTTSNIKIRRIHAGNLFYDHVDAAGGEPRSLHHRDWISRAVAMKTWPKRRHEISQCDAYVERTRGIAQTNHEDFLEIVESWHLPSVRGAKDGRHTICLNKTVLLDEEWVHEFFPFASYRWGDPITGYESEGAAAMLAGHQIAINNHLANMEEALKLVSVPRIWIDSASNVQVEILSNEIGALYKYDSTGVPPVFQTPTALAPDWVEQTRWYFSNALETLGISQFSVNGAPPAGIESGSALREFSDQVNSRWRYYQQKYEQLFVDLARIVFCLAKEEYKNGNDISATARGRTFIQKIKFSEVDIDEDMFELTVMPTSMLPKTPGARFATLDEYYSKGYISREEVLELAEIPDLERATSLASASMEDIDITIDKMLFDEIPEREIPDDLREEAAGGTKDEKAAIYAELYYLPPEPPQNLAMGIRRMEQAWAKFRHTDLPRARLDLLTRWVQDAKEMMTPPEPVEPMGPAMQPEEAPGQGFGSLPDDMNPASGTPAIPGV